MDIVTTQAVMTAVARETLPLDQIGTNIVRLLDQVYGFLRTVTIEQPGHNAAHRLHYLREA